MGRFIVRIWEKYKTEEIGSSFSEGVPEWLTPAIDAWIEYATKFINSPDSVAILMKTELRLNQTYYKTNREERTNLKNFLINIRSVDSELFFILVDYLFEKTSASLTGKNLESILSKANHRVKVYIEGNDAYLGERLPEEQLKLLSNLVKHDIAYKSEFSDGFQKIYGKNPDYTAGAGELFQSVESALKYYLGDNVGSSLGGILNWLKTNEKKWGINHVPSGLDDPNTHFLALLDYINKSFRKVKHGQKQEKLRVEKKHAESMLRAVSMVLFELENNISIKND